MTVNVAQRIRYVLGILRARALLLHLLEWLIATMCAVLKRRLKMAASALINMRLRWDFVLKAPTVLTCVVLSISPFLLQRRGVCLRVNLVSAQSNAVALLIPQSTCVKLVNFV